MISVTKLRNGVCFLIDKVPYKVTEYKHTHMSRGGGSVKVKVRDLESGSILRKTFKSTEKVDEVDVTKKTMQYLYLDGDNYIFMDPVSFEQLEINKEVLSESGVFLREGEEFEVLFWESGGVEKVLGVALPLKLTYKVTEAAPGEKGDSASNVYKEAKLENGLKVKVPLFVNVGDKVRVDTRTGEYVERA